MEDSWFPRQDPVLHDDEVYEVPIEELEQQSLSLLVTLIQRHLFTATPSNTTKTDNRRAFQMAKGRFVDLTCTEAGERILEQLFDAKEAARAKEDVLLGAIVALQSLCVMGTQVGVRGTPEQLKRMVAHLEPLQDPTDTQNVWTSNNARQLKYHVEQTAGTQLLAALKRKRTSLGAFDLLVEMGVWERHENLALLRSGFPIRFSEEEEEAARLAAFNLHDPDAILGVRKDFRREKIYTIDSSSTSEIDDGLSVEVWEDEDGKTRQRFWIHIADADRWAPRDSEVFQAAARRGTSLYLPTGSIPMFPSSLSSGLMSLTAHADALALSLGVELLPDGAIDSSSITVTASHIRVSYRLSYDEVDEMLEEGVGYNEEWQLGAMLAAAKKRREYRIKRNSSEAFVPRPIPQATISTFPDKSAPDGIGISIKVEVSHNAGKNLTEGAEMDASEIEHAGPVSPAFLMVTEMMVLAGEAIGAFKKAKDKERKSSVQHENLIHNALKLPFRCQPKPDYQSRAQERRIMEDLLERNVGGGYCHAWYSRRFFQPVTVSKIAQTHSGLGLDCYVQWTSPIRRFGDLQTHGAVKRYLRRERINQLLLEGSPIPAEITASDIGCSVPVHNATCEWSILDDDIDFRLGSGFVGAARQLQRQTQQYWLFVYLERKLKRDPNEVIYKSIVLGCVDPGRYRYAVYLPELGLEHKFLSGGASLKPGTMLRLRVASVYPETGLMTLALASN